MPPTTPIDRVSWGVFVIRIPSILAAAGTALRDVRREAGGTRLTAGAAVVTEYNPCRRLPSRPRQECETTKSAAEDAT
ncbi:hypothetical protein SSP35_19_00710 [Streptomyces sp. NBRC 110611]|nr:hypothetical protein SSP35_19_00710 [Streptomyces sp. NBRC 110611]